MRSELPVISFDIDHTLVDTERLRKYIHGPLEQWESMALPFETSVYADVLPVLPGLQEKYRLGICSVSQIDAYQRAKLDKSGLAVFFDPELIFIGQNMELLLKEMKQAVPSIQVAIDDLPTKLELIKRSYPEIVTVRIKRGKYADQVFTYCPDYEIPDLHGLDRIL